MINGILLMNGINLPISFGQFYKLAIILCLLIRFLFTVRLLISTLIITFLLLIPSIYQILHDPEGSSVFLDLIKVTKYITPFICFLFFVNAFKHSRDKIYPLSLSLVKVSYFILILNIFVKYLGLGYPAYKNGGMGSKGFFYAGNEISALLIILCSILAFVIWEQGNKTKYYIFLFINLLGGLTISSKTAILGILLVFFIIPFQGKSLKIKRFIPLITATIALLPIVFFLSWKFIQNSSIMLRFQYNYDQLDIWSFILSSRNVFLVNSYETYKNEYDFIEKIIGVGETKYEYLNDFKVVEMDIVDIFFTYGFIGLATFLLMIYFVFLQSKKFSRCNDRPFANLVTMMVLILLLISTLAGHVFGSGMSAIFIAVLFSLMYVKRERKSSNAKRTR
ncbi:O-antigen ligase family protein [Zobellia sp. B3R18]|uniref:O-antigen ligase family protein n=1 Tax=Zobellia sp. B3R18 TaxID=2841568 RepID=UPI001C076966|nr:O-antigen ligase family protein [Zobellia sp. B3R18]